MDKKLLDIVAETNLLMQSIIENGGELSEETANMLDVSKHNLEIKVDSYAYVLDQLKLQGPYWKQKASEMNAVAKGCERAAKSLQDRLKYAMKTLEVEEVAGQEYKFKLAKTAGKLVISDEAIIPDEFLVVSYIPNKEKIKEAIKSGIEVPGAYIESEPSLRKFLNKDK